MWLKWPFNVLQEFVTEFAYLIVCHNGNHFELILKNPCWQPITCANSVFGHQLYRNSWDIDFFNVTNLGIANTILKNVLHLRSVVILRGEECVHCTLYRKKGCVITKECQGIIAWNFSSFLLVVEWWMRAHQCENSWSARFLLALGIRAELSAVCRSTSTILALTQLENRPKRIPFVC